MSPPDSADGRLPSRSLDLQHLGDGAHLAVDLGLAHARGAQREGDVLVDRQVRVEREGLEHEGDVAVGGLEVLHRLAVDQDVAVGRSSSRPAMARSVVVLPQPDWPSMHDELAVVDRQVDVLDDLHGAEELLRRR